MGRLREKIKKYLPMSIKGWAVFVLTMAGAAFLCSVLQRFTVTEEYRSDVHVPLIFVLAVLIISLLTDGYFYGMLAAFASVFAVNWAFTYPYMKLDFSIYGYPLTFLTMLAVGFAASGLASGLKERDRLRIESEREKMRSNLLRAVSHDLRTPLTAISGSVSAVLDDNGVLTEEIKRELLLNAKQDAEWLYRMVENLLSITRIEGTGTGRISKTEELPEEVVGEAVAKFKKRNPGIRVEVNLPDGPAFVPMDAMLIEQVLINLMDNAVIHGKTTDRIKITLRNISGFLEVSVRDNGEGIEEEIAEHLFDGALQYKNVHETDNNRFMGIGLAVCRTIVEAHGGQIKTVKGRDKGAEFVFTLPKEDRDEYQG